LGRNSIKMYDKQGSVLRVETTINNTRDMKVYRRKQGAAPDAKKQWLPMRKGVADLARNIAPGEGEAPTPEPSHDNGKNDDHVGGPQSGGSGNGG